MADCKVAIIGGGISGLAAGFFLKADHDSDYDFTIFEKQDRLGGTIGTTREDGYIVDWGSNGFLDREPLTLEFVDRLGLREKLNPADLKSERRFIFRNDRLWEIRPNPKTFLKSGLLSLPGRLRIAFEYFKPGRKDDRDESIFDFAKRRIGKEAAETLIDPMVSGIYGGDARELSLKACFPRMFEMERMYGGLIKAMLKKKKESGGKSGGPAGPGGRLTSFEGGLYTLIEGLEKVLENHLMYPIEVRAIVKSGDKFVLETSHGKPEFDAVIIAVPAYHAARMLAGLNWTVSDMLNRIPYSSLAVVCQGFDKQAFENPPAGFGFLVPHSQKKQVLGSIWTSEIFPDQAPEGKVLLRTMLGGSVNPQVVEKPEAEIASTALEELSKMMGINSEPEYQKVIRWKNAIPQYTLGHLERMERIEAELKQIGSIFLAGNAYWGIGMNDCIKRSHAIVRDLTD
ncbi:MAG: protoporphyrinogen oxidase [candidate division Zixibacteria bacterium]|nr:protoporphyrinogen oxidase [candidate division Zixibacteria bacterium]